MKLISKLHDYYDAPFKASACDPKYVFVRETKKFKIEIGKSLKFDCVVNNKTYSFTSGVIGFCGAIYPYINRHNMYTWETNNNSVDIFYDMKDFIKNNIEIAQGKAQLTKYIHNVRKLSDIENWLTKGQISTWMGNYNMCDDIAIKSIFFDEKVAYFAIDFAEGNKNVDVITYPLLNKYCFYKKFDVYSTFQQIEHYLTNELIRPDKIDIIIPDELKAQSKGFDKWSFRKMSEKRK